MPRPETRLDAEYDPAEHHDLDRFQPRTEGGSYRVDWVCCCGEWSRISYESTTGAWKSHEQHQEESR